MLGPGLAVPVAAGCARRPALAPRHRPVPRRRPDGRRHGAGGRGRHRRADHGVLRLAVDARRPRPRRRPAAAGRGRGVLPVACSSTSRCPAGWSATCTAGSATAATSATSAAGCGPSRGNAPPARSCRSSLTVVVLLVLPSPVRSSMPLVAIALAVAALGLRARGAGAARRRPVALGADPARGGRRHPRRAARPAGLAGHRARLGRWSCAGHAVTFLIAARTAGVDARRCRSCCRWRCSCCWPWCCRNIAGWGPREGVAAWAFGAAGLSADAGRRHRRRLRRAGARRQPAGRRRAGRGVAASRRGSARTGPPGGCRPPCAGRSAACLTARTPCSAAACRSTATSTARRRSGCCSPTTPTSTGSTPSAPRCDAILVGAATVRNDNPRLLVRSQTRRDERTARGLRPSPIKVTVTERVELDACADFFTTGDAEKLVYCASPRVGRRPLAARPGGDRRRRRPAGRHAHGSARTSTPAASSG